MLFLLMKKFDSPLMAGKSNITHRKDVRIGRRRHRR
jgi:hypothetical protein